MKELILALQIFSKYGNPAYPLNCEHDVLHVMICPLSVLKEDKEKLEELGFYSSDDVDTFYSYKYGSA